MSEATRFPLYWPANWPRAKTRRRGPFKRTIGRAIEDLRREMRLLCARDLVLSTNIPLRRDGLPYAETRRLDDPGVAAYFKLAGQPRVLACDRWLEIEQNLCAIAAHVEALRGQERWGVGTLEQAFAGYAALPAPGSDWRAVFGITGDTTVDQVRRVYLDRVKHAHPDVGGDPIEMVRLNQAMDAARAALET